MTSAGFVTRTGLSGLWPESPDRWSYSTLAEVETCPRRYALRRATYEHLWDRAGYPDRVSESFLAGTAVHEAVEAVLRALKAANCESLADARAVDALRLLGGYTAAIEAGIEKALAGLDSNPRMERHIVRLRSRMERRKPEMRQAVQGLVSRMTIFPGPAVSGEPAPAHGGRTRIGRGLHPEVTLEAPDVRFMGRVDLLTVRAEQADIVDFKTGQAADHHSHQVALYGLLWLLDSIANPDRIPVGLMSIAYVGVDEVVGPPPDWDHLLSELETQISRAEAALTDIPPRAQPSAECGHCAVRHMCDEYWASQFAKAPPAATFVDVEVTILEQRGPRSWSAQRAHGGGLALIRTTSDKPTPAIGQSLRILDAASEQGEQDDDTQWTVVTVTATSEMHELS